MASRLLSTLESAGLAATATFASVLWIGLALPGLPLLPGVGGSNDSNVAISLSSAVLGVQDSRTFTQSNAVAGRQARLLSLLLPAPDPLSTKLAIKSADTEARSEPSMAVALPPAPPEHAVAPNNGPRVIESTQLASASATPPPPPAPPAPQPPVSSPPPPRKPDPVPQTPAPPTLPVDPPPPTDIDIPSGLPEEPAVAEDTPPSGGSSAGPTTTPSAGTVPAGGNNGNGNGNGNGNAGGNNAGGNGKGNAGGNNPNAGGANAGGNGNGNGNAGGNNPNAGGNNPNAGGANAGGNGNGNGAGSGAPKGNPNKGK
jgi:hypothetical protein